MSDIVSQSNSYIFPQGIPGFETIHEFRIGFENDQPLAQLTSINDENIGFILMRPEASFPNYLQDIQLDRETLSVLGTDDISMIEVWVILTLNHQDFGKTTANLRAPVLLNYRDKLGIQLILSGDQYLTREYIFKEQATEAQAEGAEA